MATERIPFTPSSNIEEILHDPDTQSLFVRFKHQSRVYKYDNVSGEEAAGFSDALSASNYLNRVIIPQHTSEQIVADEDINASLS